MWRGGRKKSRRNEWFRQLPKPEICKNLGGGDMIKKSIILFNTKFSELETKTFAFLTWGGEHKRTELLTVKQQIIILLYYPVTFLCCSALTSHHSPQCQSHRLHSENHILLLQQAQGSGPQCTKVSSQPRRESRE